MPLSTVSTITSRGQVVYPSRVVDQVEVMHMTKGKPPEQGKDIGVVRVTREGAVWVTKKEAEIGARKYKGKVVKVRDGWLVATKKRPKSN
jgi:hypothetical protein